MKKALNVLVRVISVLILVGLFTVLGMEGKGFGKWTDIISNDIDIIQSEPNSSDVRSIKSTFADGRQIDAIFEEFYSTFGGRETLGAVISPAFGSGSKIYQYVENGLMQFDGSKILNDRFSFAPLGKNLLEVGRLALSQSDQHHPMQIHSDFLLIYRRMGGAQYVGRPLGDPVVNSEEKRVEQYFENFGFYKSMVTGDVRLLPYGITSCGDVCRGNYMAANIPRLIIDLPEPYLHLVNRIGSDLTGRILSSPFISADGLEEVIFENIVLARDLQSPNRIFVRPLSEAVGYKVGKLTRQLNHPLMVFFPIEKNLGFNVPIYFLEYIKAHGGMQVSGMPIEEVVSIQPGVFRQCYKNICLQFTLKENGEKVLQPIPLGVIYKSLMEASVFDYRSSSTLDTVTIKAWELYPALSSGDRQVIRVGIFQHGIPLKNREPVLFLNLPDNGLRVFYLPPTDQDGMTEITLDPIQAPIGTLISYEVCLLGLLDNRKCEGDNYLIWNYD